MFDDAVSMIQSVRASWAPQVDERERASAEHRHRERLVAYQKRQSMRIEAERELLERHLRLGHEDARREAARKAELLAAEMAREQQELMRLLEHEVQRAQQRRAEQQARERMSYVMPGENAYLVLGAQPGVRQSVESSAEQVEASKPAWADGLWQSVVDSAYPPEQITLEPQTRGSGNQ